MLNKFKQKIKPGSFLRHVLTVASGTVIAQIIAVLVSPIITRMYTPSDMGVLASFTAIVTVLGVVAAGRYELAIVLPETDKMSNAVSFAGLIFALIFGLIVTFLTIIFNKPLVSLLKLQGDAASWSYLLGFFVLLTGAEHVLNRLAIRNRHFRVIASTQVTQQLSASSIKIGWGYFSPGTLGLFISTLFSTASRIMRLAMGEIKILFSKENRPSWDDIKNSAIRYKKFPLISSWSGFLNSASVQIPVVLFTALFSPAVAGFYSLSHRILSLPMSLIGRSVTNVFLERAAKAKDNDKELGRITLELYKKLILIGSIIMSFITFYGDKLFPFVFGEQWIEAGKYAQWISVWLVFVLAASPLSNVYTVKERQIESLIFNIILFISRILAIILPFKIWQTDIASVIFFSLTGMVIWIIFSIRILGIAGISFIRSIISTISYPLAVFGGQYLISLFIREFL